MKNLLTKIALFILIGIIYSSCNSLKRVPKGKMLLIQNEILIDGKKSDDVAIENLLYQLPNSSILGLKPRLYIHNWALQNPDSVYKAKFYKNPAKLKRQNKLLSNKQVARKGKSFWFFGIHELLKTSGEAPVILDEVKAQKTVDRIKQFYLNIGYFDAKVKFKIDTLFQKKGKITYTIERKERTFIDSIAYKIDAPDVEAVYLNFKKNSFLKKGEPFVGANFLAEVARLNNDFRNNGIKFFETTNMKFDIDTLSKKNRASIILKIEKDSNLKKDSIFKSYKIGKVNIFTDRPANSKQTRFSDSSSFNNFYFYNFEKLKYKQKSITNGIFLVPGSVYSDANHNNTSRYFNNLKIFKSTSIFYTIDKKDSLNNTLIANIALNPRDKLSLNPSLNLTRSNIQDFGISGTLSLVIRNIFRGAETFEISARSNLGASKDLANPDNLFFNISEFGIDTKLNFPRILLPFNSDRFIPKKMIPSTVLNLGFAKQQNIGLDKENFTGSMSYFWLPKRNTTVRFDLFNVQYVNNVNTANYFNVYGNSYKVLNALGKIYNNNNDYFDDPILRNLTIKEGGSNRFINDVLNGTIVTPTEDFNKIRSIEERRLRLTENNLILASSFTFSESTSTGVGDNEFYTFKAKLESAGNVLSLFAKASSNNAATNSRKAIFDVEYSQYFKTEFEYIKHFDLQNEGILAFKSFVGIAIPYGNSTTIPFSRSYFAGGSNDIRAWQPYSLGPGSSGGINDFNEANLKLVLSGELRFKLFNDLKGAVFVDAGNIWNVLDDFQDTEFAFKNFNSLKDIAIGSGFGLRYDFGFIVFRTDFGFKTYNPADQVNKRWFRDYNFANSVLNIGINYPF